jgi:hypothetical protein
MLLFLTILTILIILTILLFGLRLNWLWSVMFKLIQHPIEVILCILDHLGLLLFSFFLG